MRERIKKTMKNRLLLGGINFGFTFNKTGTTGALYHVIDYIQKHSDYFDQTVKKLMPFFYLIEEFA